MQQRTGGRRRGRGNILPLTTEDVSLSVAARHQRVVVVEAARSVQGMGKGPRCALDTVALHVANGIPLKREWLTELLSFAPMDKEYDELRALLIALVEVRETVFSPELERVLDDLTEHKHAYHVLFATRVWTALVKKFKPLIFVAIPLFIEMYEQTMTPREVVNLASAFYARPFAFTRYVVEFVFAADIEVTPPRSFSRGRWRAANNATAFTAVLRPATAIAFATGNTGFYPVFHERNGLGLAAARSKKLDTKVLRCLHTKLTNEQFGILCHKLLRIPEDSAFIINGALHVAFTGQLACALNHAISPHYYIPYGGGVCMYPSGRGVCEGEEVFTTYYRRNGPVSLPVDCDR